MLLGTALGDALGLPAEGLKPHVITRRFGRMDRFHLLGSTGFTSDDTEMTALVGHCLLRHPRDVNACVRTFGWAVRGFVARLPFGIGLATLRASFRLLLGLRRSGVPSAGNGAAMRAAVVGAFFAGDGPRCRDFSDALARVTHTDVRAVEGARFVALLASQCVAGPSTQDRGHMANTALAGVEEPSLRAALALAVELAVGAGSAQDAAGRLGTDGFVLRSVPWALWCFVRHGGAVLEALQVCIAAGGDADTNAAILGGWLGGLHGAAALPQHLLERLQGGPFGRGHLTALGVALAARAAHQPAVTPRYWGVLGLLRNLALYPVILGHGLRRLLPPY